MDSNRHLGLNILLVDDHDLNRFMVQTILEKWDCTIISANNGLHAIEQLLANPHIDLILMDMRMPVMDGKKSSEFIRNRLGANIPIIAITSDTIQYKNYNDDYITDFISKPFSQGELYEKSIQAMNDRKPDLPESCMDLSELYKQGNNDNAFICKMIDLFLEDTPKKINMLQEHLASENEESLKDIAHTIKPSLIYLASDFVSKTALSVEQNMEEGTQLIYAEAMLLVEQLKKLMAELKDFRFTLNS